MQGWCNAIHTLFILSLETGPELCKKLRILLGIDKSPHALATALHTKKNHGHETQPFDSISVFERGLIRYKYLWKVYSGVPFNVSCYIWIMNGFYMQSDGRIKCKPNRQLLLSLFTFFPFVVRQVFESITWLSHKTSYCGLKCSDN